MTTKQKTPPGLGRSGRRLWSSIVDVFELAEQELTLLREACRTLDSLDSLQALLDAEGPMQDTPQGRRVHPALVELRQQRIALARLYASLRIPLDDEEDRTQHRGGARGTYGIRGAVS